MRTAASDKPISLQHRDIALIRMLAEEFRILTGEQIGELFPMGSVRRRNFRLKQLRDAGFLSCRALMQIGNVSKPGYYLGPRAPELFSHPTERRVLNQIRRQGAQTCQAGLGDRTI